VRTFLIDKGQVDGGRLTSKGYGETQPLEDREDEQAWSKNRRVEFIILEESGPTPTEFKRPD
jgi:outer membrane protein OmpA-like peptidoglycan-associated protein